LRLRQIEQQAKGEFLDYDGVVLSQMDDVQEVGGKYRYEVMLPDIGFMAFAFEGKKKNIPAVGEPVTLRLERIMPARKTSNWKRVLKSNQSK